MFYILFYIFIFLLVAYILYTLFTKSGRLQSVKMIAGTSNVTEVGELGLPTQFKTKLGYSIGQTLRLYKCLDNAENYYILETTHKSIGSISRYYVKLTAGSIEELIKLSSATSFSASNSIQS